MDTTLTPDLVSEGQARELVTHIQNQRKALGFAVNDRIMITAAGDQELCQIAQQHKSYIM